MVAAAYLKAVIIGSVDYARRYGFEPQGEFSKAFKAFQSIEAAVLPNHIEFGREQSFPVN